MYASPVFAGGSSISNSTTNSPSASESWPGPVTTSATGMVRSPSVPAITARASEAIIAGTLSAAGEPLQRFPPRLERFWI